MELLSKQLNSWASDSINDKCDHAAASAGATIERRFGMTSPSPKLPLIQGILKYLQIAFYGHEPTIALSTAKRSPQNPAGLGQCYCFDGMTGNYSITLKEPLFISEVAIEHPYAAVRSAPYRFKVHAYTQTKKKLTAKSKGKDLGTFLFEFEKPSEAIEDVSGVVHVQEFKVNKHKQPAFNVVRFEFLGGANNPITDAAMPPKNMCLYRVRVHGKV